MRAWWDHVETIARANLRADALSDDLTAAWRALVKASGITPWLKRQADQVAGVNAAYVTKVANLPISRAVPHDILADFLEENTALITSLPSKQIQQVQAIIAPAQARGSRWEDVAKDIEERLGVTQSRARLIARDQANKFNSVMAEVTQTSAGIEEYVWTTANDFAVRGRPGGEYEDSEEDHWALRGKRFRWDSPPLIPGTGERAHPGQRIQCRCTATPVVSDLFGPAPVFERPAEIVAQEREAGYPRERPARRAARAAVSVPAQLAPTSARTPVVEPEEIPHEALFGTAAYHPAAVNVARITEIGGLENANYLRTGYRPESRAAVRAANPAALPPVSVDVYADGTVVLRDGRHRLEAAKERGDTTIRAHVSQRGADGEVVATYLGDVPVSAVRR